MKKLALFLALCLLVECIGLTALAEEPVAEEPIIEQPTIEEPVVVEPVAEEPVAEEPVAEEPVVEEPVVEEPVVEEPAAEEPVVEEPVVEEPAAEEPAEEVPAEEEAVELELESEEDEGLEEAAPEDFVVRADGTIIQYNGDSTSITLPLEVKGIAVTRLSEAVFANNAVIQNVTMPNNIQVDAGAFRNCTSLTSVSMHNSITTISAECFEGCTRLASVSWPENLVTIEHDAFSGCVSLTGVPSGTNLTTLGDNAFRGCTSLTYADLPNSLTTIGQGAFANCIGLRQIILPNSVTQMGNHAFENCSGATKLTLSTGLSIINNYCFSGCSALSEIVIPANVLEIGREAFFGCSSASIIRLPQTLVQIGNNAFGARNSESVIRWDDCQAAANVYLGTDALGTSGYILAPLGSAGAVYADAHSGVTLITTLVRDFVERCYNVILGRASDEGGLLNWCKRIAKGTDTGATIVKNFFDSTEFINKKLSNDAKVTILYQAMLNREPDAGGKAYWVNFLNVGCTTDYIINGFCVSNEFKNLCAAYRMKPGSVPLGKYRDKNPLVTAFVHRCYTKALQRTHDEQGLEYWCQMILTKKVTPASVATRFIFSDEALAKKYTDNMFVEVMYQTYFDRNPDSVGRAYWMNILAAGVKRERVDAGFAASDEYAELLKKFGLATTPKKKK